ncbi:sigma-70 family RNA polymerase sigma factor [Mangrovimonas sp. YM274]|uniref:sigma-70 family RNA polymerase sigma factor n=1 Tax=Mangrovimonas sp. YM274 TaxID=3070660 RepID=UPI0027DDAE1F|nr:sigma-70 family RNA polymerase sigma factor [Mangrovimonas sp. YM274]WMI68157.1 sigma-70 family RNA polymerase sigma factor [Mangrovimonas sp. YM274]
MVSKLKRSATISELLSLVVDKDDELAFSKLFKMLWQPLYVKAFNLLQSESIAEDVVQEIWVDFWNRRKTIKNENLEAYLFQAVTYKSYKELRDTKFTTSQLEVLEQIPAQEIEDNQIHYLEATKNRIDTVLDALPERCKEVFVLSRYHGMKNADISQELDISKRSVESYISRALKAIKENLVYFFVLIFFLK